MVLVASQGEHRIHHVLQRLRPGHGSLLGHVADHEERDPGLLGQRDQLGGALAHLSDAARHAGKLRADQRLNRINDDETGAHPRDFAQNVLQADLGKHVEFLWVETEPRRAQANLRRALLARDVEHRPVGVRQRNRELKQERGFADARIAGEEHRAARHQAAAQNAVEFANRHGYADEVARGYVLEFLRSRRGGRRARAAAASTRSRLTLHALHQAVPALARRTLPRPLRGFVFALLADEDALGFAHAGFLPRADAKRLV